MLHKELSKDPEMILTNLHPKVSTQVLTWLDMWLNHSLNIYIWGKSITLIPWITQRPWFAPPRDVHVLGPKLTLLSGGLCVCFSKKRKLSSSYSALIKMHGASWRETRRREIKAKVCSTADFQTNEQQTKPKICWQLNRRNKWRSRW